MSIVLSPITPEAEPAASAMTPPVRNFTATRSFDRSVPDVICRTGVYYIAQDRLTGRYWNHDTQAFEVYDADDWSQYVKPMFYRGPGLWGAFVGADTFAAGSDLSIKVYSNVTNNGERGTEANGKDTQIGAFTSDDWPAPLPATIQVDHNTGGADTYRITDAGNNPLEGVDVTAYLTSEYTANGIAATVRGRAVTNDLGRWIDPIRLLPTTAYTLHFAKDGYRFPPRTFTTGGLI